MKIAMDLARAQIIEDGTCLLEL
ncbi:hypothetical protein Ccrd_014318 [Cynara cardunculus var. scolymus]|uniref:Uncharacterized protein n=1 Tax=Cynara cardunculus var. scolymus TaxID=59895 RepID=A0A118K4C1_CYNCS|nr:hypothetical protein Ccrd_014318 [Cynara cardunculus var. scolymus]